ncbi:hypothetical protein ACGFNU_23250 [Spirillospora sp. NPDC048911]|uniref:hypothetical protein n=1 Tax=Spirillospora sp. NPDC048911 TaxID=3364527 RepID=UPI0037184041
MRKWASAAVVAAASGSMILGLTAPAHAASRSRPYNAGNKYGDSAGTVKWGTAKKRGHYYVRVAGNVRDFKPNKTWTYVYLSWYVGKKKHNHQVIKVNNGQERNFTSKAYTFKGKPKKAMVTVCTETTWNWQCGRPA